MNATLARVSQHRAVIVLSLVALAASLAVSIGAMFRFPSGELLIIWIVIWSAGAGAAGYRLCNWLWPTFCPLAMLAIVMAWEMAYGRTSWASQYVFMLGVTFAVAAMVGALVGTLLGKRQAAQSIADPTR